MVARFFYTLAVAMQAVIIGWRMYGLTHDPLDLGLIGLVEAVPALGLALYAGYVVDRSRPLVVYQRVLLGSLLSGVVLFVSLFDGLRLSHQEQIVAVFLASFITGLARGFSQPAVYASVPRIVPRDQLSQASAWMTTAMQIARISGPALGGLLFGWIGILFASGAVCVALVAAFAATVLIQQKLSAPDLPENKSPKNKSIKEELFLGAAFVFRHRILLPALTLDMVSVLFGGVTALLPIYASDILMTGPKGLGLLRAAPALGAVVTSLILTRVNLRESAGGALFTSVAGFGFSILVFGVSHNFALSMLALALSGAFDSVSMVIRTSAVQLVSPDSMRGRISAVNSIFIGSSNELGEFESGVAAKLLGTVPSVIFGGVMCLATVVTMAFVAPALRRMDLHALERERRSDN